MDPRVAERLDAQQRTVLYDMLSMATSAPRPGLVIDLPYRWRRETYPPVGDWQTPSQTVVSGLAGHHHEGA